MAEPSKGGKRDSSLMAWGPNYLSPLTSKMWWSFNDHGTHKPVLSKIPYFAAPSPKHSLQMCSTWANGILRPSGDIPKMLSEAYPAFASLASTKLSHVLTNVVMAEVAISAYLGISPMDKGVVSTASPNQCVWGSQVFFHFENGFRLVASGMGEIGRPQSPIMG